MRLPNGIHRSALAALAATSAAVLWWGCSATPEQTTSTGGSGPTSSSTGGTGGSNSVGSVGSQGGSDDGGICTSISAEAERVRLDMIFLVDRSKSMAGTQW